MTLTKESKQNYFNNFFQNSVKILGTHGKELNQLFQSKYFKRFSFQKLLKQNMEKQSPIQN